MVTEGHTRKFMPTQPKLERLVRGLSEHRHPGPVLVYKLNPDGTRGELIRIDPPHTSYEKMKARRLNY